MSTENRNYLPEKLDITFENLQKYYEELLGRDINDVAALEQWLKGRSELEAALEEDFAWRYIKMTCDTTDEELRKSFEYFATEIEPKIAPYNDKLNHKLMDCLQLGKLDKQKYFIYLRAIKNEAELFREENISLFSELQVEQQKFGAISGAMTVKVKDKEYTLQQAANFLKDTDRGLRKDVYEKISDRRLQDHEQLNELFDKLIKIRHQVALNAGFDNYRDYAFAAMGRFDYTPGDCFTFHEAIEKELVPILREQAEKRRSKLNVDELKPWDTAVDVTGKPALKPFKGADQLVSKTVDCFSQLDPFMGKCISAMKAENLLDLESRIGKAPGGYNYPLAETGKPFIFMNSANSLRDLTTMVHEGGHAIHTFLTSDLELNAFKHCPSEVAELASMSMELLSMKHWDAFFDNQNELLRAKHEQISDTLQTLPWVAVIDSFQHWIYTHPDHTHEERYEAWNTIFDRFGANFVDWEGYEEAKANLWQKQLHLFEVPFYYIEYAIAQLGAFAVWRNFLSNPENALQKYKAALNLGYTQKIGDIYETAGIKFDFSREHVRTLAAFVKGELEKVEG